MNVPPAIEWGVAKWLLRDEFEWASGLAAQLLPNVRSFVSLCRTTYKSQFTNCRTETTGVQFGGATLGGETKERWRELCERVVVEQDPDSFVATIQELLEVLEDNDERRRDVARLRVPRIEDPTRSSCPLG